MTDRDKLKQLFDNFCQKELGSKFNEDILDKFADYLLANGVIVPVRCKDCKHCTTLNHDLTTSYFCEVLKRPAVVEPNDYCSYGELKELK